MGNVLLKKASVNMIQRQVEKMQSETERAQKKVQSAIRGLDFEVASKRSIKSSLNKINKNLSCQSLLSEQYKNTFVTVSNSIIDSDGKFGSESQSIFDRVKSYADDISKTIKEFLINNRLAKYAAVTGLFMTAPGIASWVSTVAVLERIGEWVKGWGITASAHEGDGKSIGDSDNNTEVNTHTTNDENTGGDNRGGAGTGNANTPTQPVENTPTIPEVVKQYKGSSKDMNSGAYSNYTVISGFDEKYVLNQYDYDLQQSDGSNGGCTSTSDAMVGSFKNNQYYNPEDDWPGPGKGGANWTHTKAIEGSKNWSTSRRYTEMYNQINQGNAVVIRVSGHSMVAIGVQNGCDPNNMSACDVLIANPGTGKISTLQEYLNKSGRKLDNSWSLRIAK